MPPDVSADESGHSRREFLGRTAYAAGLAGVTGTVGRHDPERGRAGRHALLAAAEAAQRADRPLRAPDDGEPVVRPLLRLAPRLRGREPEAELPEPGGRARSAHAPRLDAGQAAECKGCGHPDPGHGWNSGRAQLDRAASSPRAAATTSSRSATTTTASSASSTRRPATTRSTTATSARCSAPPGRTATTSGRRSRAGSRRTRSGRRRQPAGRRSSTGRSPHGLTVAYYYSDLPFARRLGPARVDLARADRAVLRRRRGRHAPEHRDRGPALQGRRRRRRRSRPTSTRSATCASARPSWPTS